MRIRTRNFLHTILLLFCSLAVAACAQNAYELKETPQQASTAVLKDVAITSEKDRTVIKIVSDAPLKYTKYSITEPPRAVIDLSSTAAGGVSAPASSDSRIVRNLEILESKDQSGSLVRIVVNLVENTEFTVSTDSNDGNIIYVSFGVPAETTQAQGAADASGAGDAAPAAKVEETNPAVIAKKDPETLVPPSSTVGSGNPAKIEEPVKQEATVVPVNSGGKAEIPEKRQAAVSQAERRVITGLNIGEKSIGIITNSEITEYNSFRLSKPQRLIMDIPGFSTSMRANSIPINSFGVVNARLGLYPDKTRIVFDSKNPLFPKYRIEKSETGLVINFEDVQGSAKKSATDIASEPAQTERTSRGPAPDHHSRIESVDFTTDAGFSKIVVKGDSPLLCAPPRRTADGIVLTVKNSILPANLQRPFDTRSFNSSVERFTPYQVRTQSGPETKILVKLRTDAPFELKTEGTAAHLLIRNDGHPEAYAHAGNGERKAAPTGAFPAQAPEKRGEGLSQRASGKKVYTGRRVTLEFADADIRKIFQLIAEVSNLNFLLGDDVTGTISIKLVNVPWDQALDVILETKGLGMKRDGNIVVIRPVGKIQTLADERQAEKRALERSMELKTRVFDINYAAVGDIANQFNSVKSERGIITQDSRTNRVIVTDIEPAIEKMVTLLAALDIPEKQVMIEARIVEASSSFTRDLGIQWGIHTRGSDADIDAGFGGNLSGTAPSTPGSTFGPGLAAGFSFGKLIKDGTLDLKLYAAASNGQVKIISTPKVVTLNNKAAKIAQGQSIPYQTVSAEGTKTEFVEAALTLEVTPHITADGSVSMKIKATNNSAGAAPAGSVPPINKKEATTELLVKNGETTVIGGIYQDNDSESDDGVPFLKDIPLLGWLFKSNNVTKQKSELLIFITPKIVS